MKTTFFIMAASILSVFALCAAAASGGASKTNDNDVFVFGGIVALVMNAIALVLVFIAGAQP